MSFNNLIIQERLFKYDFMMMPKLILKMKELNSYTKCVFAAILDHIRDKGGGKCFPSQARLSEATGMGKDTVNKCLKKLKRIGLLNWKRRGQGKVSIYVLKEIPPWILQKYGDSSDSQTQGSGNTNFKNLDNPNTRIRRSPKGRYNRKYTKDKETNTLLACGQEKSAFTKPETDTTSPNKVVSAKKRPDINDNKEVASALGYLEVKRKDKWDSSISYIYTKKEKNILKNLLETWGLPYWFRVVDEMLEHWDEWQRKYKWRAEVPGISWIWGWRHVFEKLVSRSPEQKVIRKGRYIAPADRKPGIY